MSSAKAHYNIPWVEAILWNKMDFIKLLIQLNTIKMIYADAGA